MTTRDSIRGCVFGGAVGDALGWPVEFRSEYEIFHRWGQGGITAYELNGAGEAEITDDTQMALFTANGILYGEAHPELPIRNAVAVAYQDWYVTQAAGGRVKPGGICWLSEVRGLYHRRAPGNTCLQALRAQNANPGAVENYIDAQLTASKGCGSIMRVAPMGLRRWDDIEALDYEGAQIGAVTHGHALGYMPCAVLVHIVNRLVYPEKPGLSLEAIVAEARDATVNSFKGNPYLDRLCGCIDQAVELALYSDREDLENIHRLGEGWVADEALAIALYCSVKYQRDFSAGIIASVNHRGDSDSTGAVTGNILGALTGYDAIDEKWKQNLELSDAILEIADDLADERPVEERRTDGAWAKKYLR